MKNLGEFNKKKSWYFVAFILFWFYIYSVRFVCCPIRTIKLLFFIGSGLVCYKYFNYSSFKISKNQLMVIVCVGLCVFEAFLTSSINTYLDTKFIVELTKFPYVLLAFFPIVFCLRKSKLEISFDTITNFYVFAGVLQCVLALVMFLFPSVANFFNSIQVFETGEEAAIIRNMFRRLQGFGCRFFQSATINSFVLCLIANYIVKGKRKKWQLVFAILGYLIILLIGMFMARTVIVGFLLSFLFVIKLNWEKLKKIFKAFVIAMTVLLFLTSIVFTFYSEEIIKLSKFGFEMFYRLESSGKLETSSSNKVGDMIIFPEDDEYISWIIGDAKFMDPSGSGYYMHTDVGYSRYIYYFGLTGCFILFLSQTIIIIYIASKNPKEYFFFWVSWLLFLALNIKGVEFLTLYIIPFCYTNRKSE